MSLYALNDFEGINDLIGNLSEMISKTQNPQDILEVGASEFVKDLLKLAKPMSEIKKSGYTHLVDTFCYEKVKNGEIEVGWGKYYGRMVEDGTVKTKAHPHLKPTYNKNQDKYYMQMIRKIYE